MKISLHSKRSRQVEKNLHETVCRQMHLSYNITFVLKGFEGTTGTLLKHNANPNQTRDDGSTALHDASALGRAQVVRQLLKAGNVAEYCL